MYSRISNRRSQRGFTLMEILVAMAIFTTVFIVALLLYDQSNRVFKKSNESAEMQQNTRVAFDKLVGDLRMAGFDYKRAGTPKEGIPSPWASGRDYSIGTLVTPTTPNGHVYRCIRAHTSAAGEPGWTTGEGDQIKVGTEVTWQESGNPIYEQPDEQLEYLHTAAVTIRGNFDYNDPTTTDNGRETDLENSTDGRFPIVTTGNDEIVTYALVSRSGNPAANKDTISFYADVNNEGDPPKRLAFPGGEAEREIAITGVDLTNKYPPYTLMRYTLSERGVPVATALADNIRSMELSYFENAQGTRPLTDLDGVKITDLGGGGQYDPATPGDVIKERLIRSKVRSITVNITGMSPQPDRDYTHPTDTAFANYRTFELQSTIVGRNLGLKGIPQSDTNPPKAPTITSVCFGYCGVAVVVWSASEGASNDVTYSVLYDTDESGSFGAILPAHDQTSYAVDLTQLDLTATYYFKVVASNAAGSTVSTNTVKAEVKNATKPSPPTITAVSGGASARPNEIEIVWKTPTTVASGGTSCTPSGTAPIALAAAEIKGARIWRSKTSGFDPGDAGAVMILDENSSGAVTDGSGTWRFMDTTVANCETYYYRVEAVEWCGLSDDYNTTGTKATGLSDPSPEVAGNASTTVKPKAPANFKVDPTSVCSEATNSCYPVILTWDKVTQDVNNDPVVIEDYVIYRQRKLDGTLDGAKVLAGSISDGSTTFAEPSALEEHHSSGKKYTYEYTLMATYCTPPLDSAAAALTFPGACSSGASLIADLPATGSGTFADPFKGVVTLTIVPHVSKPVTSVEISVDGSAFEAVPEVGGAHQFSWVDSEDGHVAKAEFRVTTADCVEMFGVYVQNDPPPCAVEATLSNVTGVPNQLELNVKNITPETVTIDNFDIAWSGLTGWAWNSVTLPSGATPVATGTSTAARTVTFTPSVGSDKSIAAGATYRVLMNFTGSGFIYAGSVSSFRLRYKQASTGSTPLECAPSLVPCSVRATASSGGTNTFNVVVTNNSAEEITLKNISIDWAGQNKWQWNSLTTPAGTIALVTPSEGSTETFSVSGQKVAAGATFTVVMNMSPNKPSPPTLDVGNVGVVTLEYTSPLSAGTVLECRAK